MGGPQAFADRCHASDGSEFFTESCQKRAQKSCGERLIADN
jgi:hypothetical protein